MCLTLITTSYSAGEEQSGVGYKIYRKTRTGKLASLYFPYRCCFGRWMTATKGVIHIPYADEVYETGFHIYLDYKNARLIFKFLKSFNRDFVLCKVQYRQGHTLGVEDGNIIVAREMKILSKRRKR